MVAHACNLCNLGGQGKPIIRGQEFQTSLANMAKPISTKIQEISQVWWHTPVVSATWEAEAGGGCSEPRLSHCTVAWTQQQ